MNLVALIAALNGDLENAIAASTPGGIEAQERTGQIAFVANETLPIRCNYGTTREQIEAMGVEYGDPVDDLFVAVKLPDGWAKVATDHAMWSKLVDEQGRERASIFYKAAFYDRGAFINISHRFSAGAAPVCGWDSPEYVYATTPMCGAVEDCGRAIWRTEETVTRPAPDADRSASRAVASHTPAPGRLTRQRLGVLYVAITAAAVLLALGYFAVERLNRSKPGVLGTASIAVLPLANESGEASQQYFSDGISEDLITALSQFPGLKVIART